MLGETSEADGYYSLLLFELIVLIIMSESRSFSGLVIEFPSTRKQLNFAANTHTATTAVQDALHKTHKGKNKA